MLPMPNITKKTLNSDHTLYPTVFTPNSTTLLLWQLIYAQLALQTFSRNKQYKHLSRNKYYKHLVATNIANI